MITIHDNNNNSINRNNNNNNENKNCDNNNNGKNSYRCNDMMIIMELMIIEIKAI